MNLKQVDAANVTEKIFCFDFRPSAVYFWGYRGRRISVDSSDRKVIGKANVVESECGLCC